MKLAPIILLFSLAGFVEGVPPTIDAGADPSRPIITAVLPADVAHKLGEGQVNIARFRDVLRLVRLDDQTHAEGPPIFGAYSLVNETLHFEPEFPLGEGAYRMVLALPGAKPELAEFDFHKAHALEATQVEKVYPSSDALPANLLKFYVYFSQPVRQTEQIFDQVHILDAAGKPVYDPWRRFQQWSDDGKRFTLWIHPGRVKQGVNLREDFGPVLQPDHKYTLVIDADLLDLSGRPMHARFEKHFTAIAEVHHRISLDRWKVSAPKAGTREPLVMTFPRPLDWALMQRLIAVRDATGNPVAGHADAGDGEKVWSFRPEQPWSPQLYTVHANDLLEDLAGNSPVRVFDTDMQHPETRPSITSIPFHPQ